MAQESSIHGCLHGGGGIIKNIFLAIGVAFLLLFSPIEGSFSPVRPTVGGGGGFSICCFFLLMGAFFTMLGAVFRIQSAREITEP